MTLLPLVPKAPPSRPAQPPASSQIPPSSLAAAVEALRQAPVEARAALRTTLVEYAATLVMSDAGLQEILGVAAALDASGVFEGGPWQDPTGLVPALVAGGLLADPAVAAMETLNLARMDAIASGRAEHSRCSPEQAVAFLQEVLVKNIRVLSATGTEATRDRVDAYERARRVLSWLLDRHRSAEVRAAVVLEVDALAAQQPVSTRQLRHIVSTACGLFEDDGIEADRLAQFRRAIGQPSSLSREHQELSAYRDAIASLEHALHVELEELGSTLRSCRLATPYHVEVARKLARERSPQLGVLLGLNATGQAGLGAHRDLVCDVLLEAIHPETADALLGLALTLERGLLSRGVLARTLSRMTRLDLAPATTRTLLARIPANSRLSASSLLLAGVLSLLGQPLGVGQGNNPTCQSARALSLWSHHAPAYLLHLVVAAARNGSIEFDFEGDILVSSELDGGVAERIDPDLDPVSLLLVPHLDRVYDEMMRRALGRVSDAHRWVNPAFYGRWVPSGFACAIDLSTGLAGDFPSFVRRFVATHHPSYNDGEELLYPNPVGIFVTDAHGRLLGRHAITIRRVQRDADGHVRVYFFNPNNEGRQDWGLGAVTAVHGHGEVPGESSLCFEHFAARLYAFHYDRHEGGEPEAVVDALVDQIVEIAKRSWGPTYALTA